MNIVVTGQSRFPAPQLLLLQKADHESELTGSTSVVSESRKIWRRVSKGTLARCVNRWDWVQPGVSSSLSLISVSTLRVEHSAERTKRGIVRWRISRRPHSSASQLYSTAQALEHPTTCSTLFAILDERCLLADFLSERLSLQKTKRKKVMIGLRRSMHSTRCSLCNVKVHHTFARVILSQRIAVNSSSSCRKTSLNSLSTLST